MCRGCNTRPAWWHRQLGLPIASTAPLARITEAFDKAVHRFARDHGLAWVDFAKGQGKDDIAHEYRVLNDSPGEHAWLCCVTWVEDGLGMAVTGGRVVGGGVTVRTAGLRFG